MAINALGLNDDVVSDAFERKTKEPRVQVATAAPSTASDAGGQPPAAPKSPYEIKAGLESDKEAIMAVEAKRKKAESEAKSAAEKQRQAAIYEQYKPELTKKFEPFEAPKETFSSLAGIGMMLMAIGSMGGKKGLTSATGAMNAIAGMATGYQQGRKEEFDRQKQIFDENFRIMKENQAQIQKEFEYALKYAQKDLPGATAKLATSLRAKGMDAAATSLEQGKGSIQTVSDQVNGPMIEGLNATENKLLQINRAIRLSDAKIEEQKAAAKPGQKTPDQIREEAKAREEGRIAASADGVFSPEARNLIVERFLDGDKTAMQYLGTSKASQSERNKIFELMAEKMKERGMEPKDIIAAQAEAAGVVSASRALGQIEARTVSPAVEAQRMGNLALKLSKNYPRDKFVPFNKLFQMVDENISDPDLLKFKASVGTYARMYARATTPVGGATDKQQAKADQMLSTVTSSESFEEVVNILNQEMAIAQQAPIEAGKAITGGYTGRAPQPGATAPKKPAEIRFKELTNSGKSADEAYQILRDEGY
jgi:hypothetical protein